MLNYKNDKDLSAIIYTEITDEKVLNFIFKKGGKVNITNLQWCVSFYTKKSVEQNIINLKEAGLIKIVDSDSINLSIGDYL